MLCHILYIPGYITSQFMSAGFLSCRNPPTLTSIKAVSSSIILGSIAEVANPLPLCYWVGVWNTCPLTYILVLNTIDSRFSSGRPHVYPVWYKLIAFIQFQPPLHHQIILLPFWRRKLVLITFLLFFTLRDLAIMLCIYVAFYYLIGVA